MAANVTKIHPDLANYWWYEHLLCLPDVDTEIVTHFGERLKELPTGNMPASLAVRLFLRQIMLHSMTEEELLFVMGLFQLHSEKQQQFQSTAVAQAIQPPDALLIEVLQQYLVSYCLQSFQQGQSLHDITAAVEQQALQILQQAQVERLLESEQLKQSVATLQRVLGSVPQPQTLDAVQQLLYNTFPKHLMEADLQQFAKSAWKALGASSLEVFQRATLSGLLPFHPFLNFLQENEEFQHESEQHAQQQQAEPAGADNPAVAATPGEPLIIGGQQQELVIPDSTDPVAANKLTQPSSTPGIPSPRSGSDPAPAAAGGKQQRRVGDLAAAAVRGQLNLLPSTAAARNIVNQQQQQCTAAVGEENTPPEEQAAVLQASFKTQTLAAAAAKQQQLGRGTFQPPRPLAAAAAAAAVPVLTWEEQVMGHAGAGIAWGGDRRKLKNDKIRAEKQQTAEERARRRAEREEREAQQKAARKLLKEQERARREEEKKAAEAARRAEAKAARAKQRQEEERRKEVERELARLQREEARAAKQAEKEELKKERAAARKAAQAGGKKAILDSEEEMEIPEEGEEDEEEFVSIAEDSSDEDLSSESDGWSTESTSVQELGSDEAGDHSSRPAAAAAARKAGSKIRKPLPQAKIRRERVSGSDSDQQASGGHGRVAPGRGRKPSKQPAAATEDSEDLFADLEVKSDVDSDQPAIAAAAAAGGSKRKPDTTSEDPVAAAALAGPSKKRKTAAAAAAAAHGVEGRPARPDLEQGEVQPAAAAAEPAIKQQKSSKAASSADAANPAKKGLCGRGGPKTGAGRTLQWDSSPSERADELKTTSPSACRGPQTAAEMRAQLARHREKNGGVSVAAAMLELLAQKKRDKGPGGDMSDDEEEADKAARARDHRREASKRQAAAAEAEAAEVEEAVEGSGGDIYDYVMNGSDEEQQRRKRKKKQKKAAAAAAAASGDATAGGAAAARVPDIAGAAPAGAGAGPKAPSSSTPSRAAEAEGKPGGRRKVVRWSKQEEVLLEQLVEKYGVGKWAAIKEEGAGTFLPHRTAVDLKDKWRNILKGRGLF